jgi:hypothetical protein
MYSQHVKGDGGCLFTSLAISLRCKKILKEPICYSSSCLNSQNNEHSGFQIRQAIIHFLLNHLNSEIQELGTFYVIKDENDKNGEKSNELINKISENENDANNSVYKVALDIFLEILKILKIKLKFNIVNTTKEFHYCVDPNLITGYIYYQVENFKQKIILKFSPVNIVTLLNFLLLNLI